MLKVISPRQKKPKHIPYSDAVDMLHREADSAAAECWTAALTPATCLAIDFSTADEFGMSLNQYRASVFVWSFELHTLLGVLICK